VNACEDRLDRIGRAQALPAGFRKSKIREHAVVVVAQDGSNWYFAGEGGRRSSCWRNSDLDQLESVPGTAFEVIKTGRILRKS
jgi:hypothetical protein